jgi:hypothetical protein
LRWPQAGFPLWNTRRGRRGKWAEAGTDGWWVLQANMQQGECAALYLAVIVQFLMAGLYHPLRPLRSRSPRLPRFAGPGQLLRKPPAGAGDSLLTTEYRDSIWSGRCPAPWLYSAVVRRNQEPAAGGRRLITI